MIHVMIAFGHVSSKAKELHEASGVVVSKIRAPIWPRVNGHLPAKWKFHLRHDALLARALSINSWNSSTVNEARCFGWRHRLSTSSPVTRSVWIPCTIDSHHAQSCRTEHEHGEGAGGVCTESAGMLCVEMRDELGLGGFGVEDVSKKQSPFTRASNSRAGQYNFIRGKRV
ncbi:hypothetical protein X797_007797 [Metarhizium robertsii]|uniref:Uncharacterized protein n=1 Tax=Metarhizium robertsii TaxID=568076 RepID=A0A0A1USM6_9HYPO|nr:hypothetical protein X797_007797 [Metarhizium robertsii]